MAANIFTGATSSSWNVNGNWSLGVFPVSGDGNIATLNASSPACNINVTSACDGLDTTGYTNTITKTNILTIHGNATFSATTIISGSAAFNFNLSATIVTNGLNIGAVTFSGTISLVMSGTCNCTTIGMATNPSTITITGNIVATGLVSITNNNISITGGGTITCQAGFSFGGVTTSSGTTTIIVTGGTVTWAASGTLTNDLTCSNVTFSNTNPIKYQGGTLTCTSGTNTATGVTLQIGASTTLSTSAVTWGTVSITATSTNTVNSLLSVSGTLSLTGDITFSGSAGFNVGTFSSITAGNTHTLVSGITYIVGNLTVTGTAASKITIKASSVGGTKAILTLTNIAGPTQDVSQCIANDIDSSLGSTIWNYKGTNTNTVNWNILTPVAFGSANTFVM